MLLNEESFPEHRASSQMIIPRAPKAPRPISRAFVPPCIQAAAKRSGLPLSDRAP